MKKFVLYTAVFGKPGVFRSLKLSMPNIDKFCYTDLDIKNDFYQIKKMNLDHLISTRKRNRFAKICIPDEIFNNYEYSLYLDAKHPMKIDFDRLLNCMKPESDFLVQQHWRDCVYDEGMVCIKKEKDNKKVIMKQLNFYKSENYPAHNGLYAAYWIFRRHTKKLKEFSKLWWEQVDKYSYRDQISLPYVAWKYGMKISICGRNK